MSDLIKLSETLLEQSNTMLTLANDEQWDELETVQVKHAQLIQQLTTADFTETDATRLRALLLEIQNIDQQTEQLALENKARIVKQKQTQGKASKMQKALDAFK